MEDRDGMILQAFSTTELPLQGPALAAVISAFGVIIAMFVRAMFKASRDTSRTQAYAFALLEKQVKDCERREEECDETHRQQEAKYELLLKRKDDDRARLAEECRSIRDERDALAIENARLRGGFKL